jgi:hypothetical protein
MIVNNDTNAMSIGANIDYELDQTLAATFQRQLVGLKSFDDAGDDDAEDDGGDAARAPGQLGSVRLTDAQIVRPGDLITADFVNKLLGRLARLEAIIGLGGAAERGTFAMPYFFGVVLFDVLDGLASRGLKLRKVVDISGQVLADSKTATFNVSTIAASLRRLALTMKAESPVVLGQYPVPKARVKRGEMVSLLVNLRGVTDDATRNSAVTGEASNTFTLSAPQTPAGTKATKRSPRKTKTAGKTTDTTPVVPG